MFNLSPSEEESARESVTDFLKGKGENSRKLTLEGIKCLRGVGLHGGVLDLDCGLSRHWLGV